MLSSPRRQDRQLNVWPGYVDALSALLMLVIFLLLIFTAAQIFLSRIVTDQDSELDQLTQQISELSQLFDDSEMQNQQLRDVMELLSGNVAELETKQQQLLQEREQLTQAQSQLQAQYTHVQENLQAIVPNAIKSDSERQRLTQQLRQNQQALKNSEAQSEARQVALTTLSFQLIQLRRQLQTVQQALLQAEVEKLNQQSEIKDLGARLNVALAKQVNRLAKYRSEFFEKLTQALQGEQRIRVEGDRFILPTELLFHSGSATLGHRGQQQLTTLANTLKDISKKIPQNLSWVLRVDGHTDIVPIRTSRFDSNWALSSARALSVVRFLQSQGIAGNRLAAAGFGEHHPIDPSRNTRAYAKNRRIEFKLTQR